MVLVQSRLGQTLTPKISGMSFWGNFSGSRFRGCQVFQIFEVWAYKFFGVVGFRGRGSQIFSVSRFRGFRRQAKFSGFSGSGCPTLIRFRQKNALGFRVYKIYMLIFREYYINKHCLSSFSKSLTYFLFRRVGRPAILRCSTFSRPKTIVADI